MVIVELPSPDLSPNARLPWPAKMTATRTYRHYAQLAVIAAGGQSLGWKRAIAQTTFYFPDERRRDIANAEAMLKPMWDGFVDAGLIVDDSHGHLQHEPTVFAVDALRPRVEVLIRPVEVGTVRCPSCGTGNPATAERCRQCSQRFPR